MPDAKLYFSFVDITVIITFFLKALDQLDHMIDIVVFFCKFFFIQNKISRQRFVGSKKIFF